MLYTVIIFLNGQPHLETSCFGFDVAKAFEDAHPEDEGFEVSIEPNIYGYIKLKHPTIGLSN